MKIRFQFFMLSYQNFSFVWKSFIAYKNRNKQNFNMKGTIEFYISNINYIFVNEN